MNVWERVNMLEGQRWEWRISMVFCSIIFLLFAVIEGLAALGEWQERTLWIGMIWGAFTPLGYLVWTVMNYLDKGKPEDEGCLLAFFLSVISFMLIIPGILAGIVIAFQYPSISTGYVLSFSAGLGTSIMAKNSYALYQGI